MKECATEFGDSLGKLKADLMKHGDGGMLVWDKVNTGQIN